MSSGVFFLESLWRTLKTFYGSSESAEESEDVEVSGDIGEYPLDFYDALDQPKSWCGDLLSELADTHHVMFTCDQRGTYRERVNRERREFLERVLGLEDVSYYVCEACESFVLLKNAQEWESPAFCGDCSGGTDL